MRTIWKFELNRLHASTIDLPVLSVPRFVVMQEEWHLMLLVDLDPSIEQTELRTFLVLGTGHKIPPGAQYVGTCQDGSFVWHVYEDVNP